MNQYGPNWSFLSIVGHCWVIVGNFMQLLAILDHFGQFCDIFKKLHTAHLYEQKVKHGLNCQMSTYMVLENH